jgi:hypothetical protein
MLVSLQAVIRAEMALNVTTLWPCVTPKLEPVMVTEVPIPPVPGEMAEIAGVGGVCA